MDSLDSKSDNFLCAETLKPLAMHYKYNIHSLGSELNFFLNLISRHSEENETNLESLLKILQILERYKLAFNDFHFGSANITNINRNGRHYRLQT